MDEARKLTKYLVMAKFPQVRVMLLFDVLIAIAVATVVAIALNETVVDIIIMYLILFSFPSILATFIPIIRRDYSGATNLLSLIIEIVIFTICMLIARDLWTSALVVAYALSFSFRYIIFVGLGMSSRKALSASSLRILLSFSFFYIWDIFIGTIPLTIEDIAQRLVTITALLGVISLLFIYLISLPVRKLTGINPFDLLAAFMTDWFHRTATLEEYLKSTNISEKTRVFLDVIIFYCNNNNKEIKQIKAAYIISYIHPGPFGNVGSSNMPYLLSERIEKEFNAPCFVFHGSCSHDLNIVSGDDVNRVIDDVVGGINEFIMKPSSCGISEVICDENVNAMRLGDKDMVFISGYTGDIELGVGLASSDMFVDCHSSGETVMKSIIASSKEGMEIIGKCRKVRKGLKDRELTDDISISISKTREKIENRSIGKGGIIASALDIGGQRIIHVLVDSNNMEPGLRGEIINHVKNETNADIVDVMTSDTHYTNTVSGGINLLENDPDIVESCVKIAKNAIENKDNGDNGKIKVGTKRVYIDNVQVMGSASEFVTSLNFSAALFKVLIPVVVILMIIAIFGTLLAWG